MSFFSTSETKAQSRPLPSDMDMSAVMRSVYTWLSLALLVCFGIAFALRLMGGNALEAAMLGDAKAIAQLQSLPMFNPVVSIVALVVYLGLGFFFYPIIQRVKPAVGGLLLMVFAATFGLMISATLMVYSWSAIIAAFLATAGMFGAMTVIGYTTKADLSKMGSILMMGLIGLLIATIINIFLRSGLLGMIISFAGVAIFTALVAYDTWWIKNNAGEVARTGDKMAMQRVALFGAFHLFMDFVNLFLYILRIISAFSSRD